MQFLRTLSILIILITCTLSGCGGGSGGGGGGGTTGPEPLAKPQLTLSISGCKELLLEWNPIDRADHYRVLHSSDGGPTFTVLSEASNVATTSTTLELAGHLTDWGNAKYQVEACSADETETTTSDAETLPRTLSIAATGYIKASNTGASDWFGSTLALNQNGDTLVVAAEREDSNATTIDGDGTNNSADSAGAAYVFVKSGNSWAQQAYLKASNTDSSDRFGYCADISNDGNTVAVGAFLEQSTAQGIDGNQNDNTGLQVGAVYVFTRAGTTWSQQAYIKASNADSPDRFATSLALSGDGNTLVVGAHGEASNATGVDGNQNDDSEYYSGAAYVFTRSGTTWSQQAYIKASNPDGNDSFGRSIALSNDGNTLAVGTTDEQSNATGINGDDSNNAADNSGAVYVYTRSGTTWSHQAYIKASNTEAEDYFSSALALSGDGNILAVGAEREDSAATGIDGNQADNTAGHSGAVYIFSRTGTTWQQTTYIKASNTGLSDGFGYTLSLDIDGDTLAVGAYNEDSSATGVNGANNNSSSSSGAAYIFTRTGTTWNQKSYVKASNTAGSDCFGYAVDLSGDGETLAVSANCEESNATGFDGDQGNDSASDAGAVYIY